MAGTDEAAREHTQPQSQGQTGAVAELKLRVPVDLSDWLAGYAERGGRGTRGESRTTPGRRRTSQGPYDRRAAWTCYRDTES